LTFRAGKKHKSQESTKAGKNALKLASRFQHFLNTGVVSKKDLKEIDERFSSQISQQGDRVLTVLDQVREGSSGKVREVMDETCEFWAKWLSTLNSKETLGYSNLKITDGGWDETSIALLEGVVDSESHLFQMLFALKSSLSAAVKNPDSASDARLAQEFAAGTKEVVESFHLRQRMMAKIASAKR
jgi:hypothetical protein